MPRSRAVFGASLGLLVLAAFTPGLPAQDTVETARLVWSLRGQANNSGLGSNLVPLGDIDGDGHDDLAVSEPGFLFEPLVQGVVHIVSGAEGRVLRTFVGPPDGPRLARTLAAVGDLDGDGRIELAVGVRGGRLLIVDPDTLSVLRELTFAEDPFGVPIGASVVARMPDIDGDGVEEVALGQSRWVSEFAQFGRGRIEIWSLERAERLWFRVSDVVGGHFGAGMASIGDVTGDGAPDLVVAEPNSDSAERSVFWILDARSGAPYQVLPFPTSFPAVADSGRLLVPPGASNRLVVSTPLAGEEGREFGWQATLSLPGPALVHEQRGSCGGTSSRWGDLLGITLDDVGDLDGDGVHDYGVGTYRAPRGALFAVAYLLIRSGRTDELLWVLDGIGVGGSALFVNPFRLRTRDPVVLRLVMGSLATEFDATSGAGRVSVFDLDTSVRPFVRGDANQDGRVSIADLVTIFRHLVGGVEAPPCLAALDANASGSVIAADAVHLAMFLFRGDCAPEPPYPECARHARVFRELPSCESYLPCDSRRE